MGTWEITKKDLLLILKDKRALCTLLALPVAFIAILGVSTGELITTHEASKLVKVGVVDEDGSELAEHIIHDLSQIGGLKVEKVADRDEGTLLLQNGYSSVIVILGTDFHNRIDELLPGDVIDMKHGM